LIELDKISFAYEKTPVLTDVSLNVQESEMLGIIGPNSSGKSTLLKIMAGILKPDKGVVEIEGNDIKSLLRRETAKSVSFVPQETPASFPFTVMETVLLGRTPHLASLAFESEEDLDMARKSLESTDTLDLQERFFEELSGGEKQLVTIARALAQDAPVMLFDEPTTFLDIRHQIQIFEVITRLNRESRRTVVVVSHDLNIASLYCSRLVLLREGRIAIDGPPEEVIKSHLLKETYGVDMRIISALDKSFVLPERLQES